MRDEVALSILIVALLPAKSSNAPPGAKVVESTCATQISKGIESMRVAFGAEPAAPGATFMPSVELAVTLPLPSTTSTPFKALSNRRELIRAVEEAVRVPKKRDE